jgi:hypothetical protein
MSQPRRQRFAVALRRPGTSDYLHCRRCGYTGRKLDAHLRYHWYYLPAGFLLGCTGIGLLPLALVIFYLGRLTRPACPACLATSRLTAWHGVPTAEADQIWRKGVAEDRREFLRTKLSLMATMALVLGAIALYLLIRLWF